MISPDRDRSKETSSTAFAAGAERWCMVTAADTRANSDDQANGQGVMVWAKGQRYEGQWLQGNRRGRGRHSFG